ncbi:MAG: hypothetical protein LBJ10_04170 [Clostridiales bacterium]|jgi:hypothetical protein|nr:hypothetical protein [Clostridiales bacterium]
MPQHEKCGSGENGQEAGGVSRTAAFCFFAADIFTQGSQGTGGAAANYVNELDSLGCDVHLFNSLGAKPVPPSAAIGAICDGAGGRLAGERYLFMTDMPGLLRLAYRLYQSVFVAFALFGKVSSEGVDGSDSMNSPDGPNSTNCPDSTDGSGSTAGSGSANGTDIPRSPDSLGGAKRSPALPAAAYAPYAPYAPVDAACAALLENPPRDGERLNKPIFAEDPSGCFADSEGWARAAGKATVPLGGLIAFICGSAASSANASSGFCPGPACAPGGAGNAEASSGASPAEPVSKAYRIGGRYYLYEPCVGERVVVDVGEETGGRGDRDDHGNRAARAARGARGGRGNRGNRAAHGADTCAGAGAGRPSAGNTAIELPFDAGAIANLEGHFVNLREYAEYYFSRAEAVDAAISDFGRLLSGSPDVQRAAYINYAELLAEPADARARIMLLSALAASVPDAAAKTRYLRSIYECLLGSRELCAAEKYFAYWQCARLTFVGAIAGSAESARLSRALYREIYEAFRDELKPSLSFIPKAERDPKFALVLTTQMLSLEHAPTKTALDRARSLIAHLGMDAMIVNTREILTVHGALPFFNAIVGSAVPEYDALRSFAYGGIDIPFRQLPGPMPAAQGIGALVGLARQKRPYFILCIGGNSPAADVLSNIAPTICIGTVPSGLCCTEGQFQTIGRRKTEADAAYAERWGFPEGHIIESLFTWNFKPQAAALARAELGLPEGKFLLAVVGARLDDEVTGEFLDALLATTHAGTHIVFAGSFAKHAGLCAGDGRLAAHSSYIGFQSDMLAVFETCDLYVNPNRVGGGSSAAEALYKGLPAVTLPRGDVPLATGADFCVSSFGEMSDAIMRYATDRAHYGRMAQKARERAATIMDTGKQLEMIVGAAVGSPLFH